MEILYLWIKKYRTIEHQGFNFGGEFEFHFDYEAEQLFCERNNFFIKDFYGPRIKNVTAIIGKNGSGKSSLLDFINLNISVDIGNTNLNYLCLFKEEGRSEIFIYNTAHKNLILPVNQEHLFEIAPRGRIDGYLSSLLYPTAFMFYSPDLNFNHEVEHPPFDISMTELLRKSKSDKQVGTENEFYDLITSEVRKQVNFASEFKDVLPFQLPEELIMYPNNLSENVVASGVDFANGDLLIELKSLREKIDQDVWEYRGERELYYLEIYRSLFWHSILFLLNSNLKIEVMKCVQAINRHEASQFSLKNAIEVLYKYDSINAVLPSQELVSSFFSLLRAMDKTRAVIYWFARFNFQIRPEQNFRTINSFLNIYGQLSLVGPFIGFSWSGLSSGQQAMFSMFARFYALRPAISKFSKRISENRVQSHGMAPFDGIPDCVVLIDEGETYLHPQWQKEFIHNITTYLPSILDLPRLQIILASNSPFLISDLPNYNVLFLNYENDKTVVNRESVTTFGANIHDLLANTFFLDSTIGKLAEKKINDVIQLLQPESQVTFEQIEYIQKFVRLIDDQLIQEKLLQMLALKVDQENWEEYMLEQQSKIIREKLDRIKKNRRND